MDRQGRHVNTSPSQLQEVTMDRDSSSFVASPNWNNTSGNGHTMKEYEEQLAALRKENFNLKLRVYFLEERLDASTTVPHQDNIVKKNIELKVNLESLRRELDEKKELLCAAAKALEIYESTAAKKEEELNTYINVLEEELNELRCDSSKSRDGSETADINADTMTVGIDNSVALYAAAFNIKPQQNVEIQPSEEEKALKEECEKLKDMLASERDIGAQLRETVAVKDQLLYEQSKKLQTLSIPPEQTNEDNVKLEKLQQENVNACQVIQSCLIRIKQMDKEARKLKSTVQKREENITNLQGQLRRLGVQLAQNNVQSEDALTTTDVESVNLIQEYKNMQRDLKACSPQKEGNTSDEKEYEWMNTHLENKIKNLQKAVVNEEELQKNIPTTDIESESNLQDVLTNRLQELAYFLDSLLHHKCVLEDDKRRKVEKLLEQSLDLTSCLTLDPEASKLMGSSLMDWSFNKSSLSQSLKLDNLTKLFGHHFSLDDSDPPKQGAKKRDICPKKSIEEVASLQKVIGKQDEVIEKLYDRLKTVQTKCICASSAEEGNDNEIDELLTLAFQRRTPRKRHPKTNRSSKAPLNFTWHGPSNIRDQSESESWSEPDRNVSLARMGGIIDCNVGYEATSEDDVLDRLTPTNTNQKYSINSKNVIDYENKIRILTEEKENIEKLLTEANHKVLRLHNENDKNLKDKQDQINSLTQKLDEAENSVSELSAKLQEVLNESKKNFDLLEEKLSYAEVKVKDLATSLDREKEKSTKLEKEQQMKRDGEWVSKSRYDALRKEVDQAALQASQATLDRTVAVEQRMRTDAEVERLNRSLSQAKLRLSELESYCAELMKKIAHLESWTRPPSRSPSTHSHSPRASSPDQGIDSDRLSSLEMVETIPTIEHYPGDDLATENMKLREKLEKTQKKLMFTVSKLNEVSSMKKKVNRSICQEIHKTTSVLRQVRDNLNLNGDS